MKTPTLLPTAADSLIRELEAELGPLEGPERNLGDDVLDHLDSKIDALLQDIHKSELWAAITAPDRDLRLLKELMKEIHLEIFSYQADVIEATIAIIGQMPRSLDSRKVRAMLIHQAEEFSHGEMALRDYILLGGDEKYAREQHLASPAAFSTMALWRMIQSHRDPFMYLGALYMFEGLTPIISGMVKPYLKDLEMPAETFEFLEFHSTEDIKHTNLIRHLIRTVVAKYPEAAVSAKYGLDCFLAVYPVPVWNAALERAKQTCAVG